MRPLHVVAVRTLPVLLACASLAGPASAADTASVDAESRIERVTVYEDRALVTRGAKVKLEPGVTEVRFGKLPPTMDQDTLVARTGGALVLGVDVETVQLAQASSEAVRTAQLALETQNRRVKEIEMERQAIDARTRFLDSIRVASGEKASAKLADGGALDLESLTKVLDFLDGEGAKIRKAVLDTEDRLQKAVAVRDAAARTLQQLQGQRHRSELQVVVTLESEAGGEIPIALQYLVHGAAWRPSYDLRVSGDFQKASIGLTAVVTQQTGEDWEGVELLLTTAQPAAGTKPPALTAWRIGGPPPGVVSADAGPPAAKKAARRARSMDRKDAFAADAMADEELEMRARVRRSGVVVAFEARLPETVRSDGQAARVSLARYDIEPDVWWTAHPELSKKVYVTARVRNSTGTPLPGGTAKVFLGTDFVGRMPLEDWSIGERIGLGLGVDRAVEVKREVLESKRSTEGIFSKEVVHTRRFRVTVHNHHERPVRMRIRERIPVSNNEDIEVEVTENSHELAELPAKEAELNQARGFLQWHERAIAAGRLDVTYAFEVRHPKDQAVNGLNR